MFYIAIIDPELGGWRYQKEYILSTLWFIVSNRYDNICDLDTFLTKEVTYKKLKKLVRKYKIGNEFFYNKLTGNEELNGNPISKCSSLEYFKNVGISEFRRRFEMMSPEDPNYDRLKKCFEEYDDVNSPEEAVDYCEKIHYLLRLPTTSHHTFNEIFYDLDSYLKTVLH